MPLAVVSPHPDCPSAAKTVTSPEKNPTLQLELAYAEVRSDPPLRIDLQAQPALDRSPDRLISISPDRSFPTGGSQWGPCLEPGFGSKRTITGKRGVMRSNLVYSAGRTIENRFLLATVVIRAVRILHINSTRTEDTANRIFSDISEGRYASSVLPEPVPPPVIEPLLITPGL